MMRKVCSVLVTLSMMMALLVSCGGGTGDTSSNTASGNTNNTDMFSETIRDLDGKTIKLASFWADWTGGESASVEQQECAKALEAIQKDYNCKIELITLTDTYTQDINTAIASGTIYANILELQSEHLTLASGGNLMNVKEIKNLEIQKNKWDTDAAQATSIGDKQYGVGFLMPQQQSTNRNVLVFNKELVNQYSLGNFYEMVQKGEWTFDKFTSVCQDVVTKSNGAVQGMIDQYGQGNHFIFANATSPLALKDNKYQFNGMDEKVLRALQFLQDYNKKGLYDIKDYVGKDYGLTESNVFMSRKTLFFNTDYWTVPQIFASGMPDDYGVLPFPKGPDAEDYTTIVTNSRYFSFIKGDPDIEDAATIMVAIANRCHLTNEEWIQKQAETALRDDESIEMLELILNSPSANTSANSPLGLDYIVATNDVIYDMSKTPKQAMEGIAEACQAKVDEYYGQK